MKRTIVDNIKRIKDGTIFAHIKKRQKKARWSAFIKSNDSYTIIRAINLVKLKILKNSQLSIDYFFDNHEKKETNFILRFLKKGDVFIDIGANIGYFSALAAYKKCIVFSIEPAWETFKILQENMSLNRFHLVRLFNQAISDSDGMNELNTSVEGFDAWNSFTTPILGHNTVKEIVKTQTLDSFCEQNNLLDRVTFIKVDVEGWEPQILKGAGKTLQSKNSPILMIEFTENTLKNNGFSCEELVKLIHSFNYKLYEINMDGKILTEEKEIKKYRYSNLICLKDYHNLILTKRKIKIVT